MLSTTKVHKRPLNVSLILANANDKKRLVGDYSSSSSYCYALIRTRNVSTRCNCIFTVPVPHARERTVALIVREYVRNTAKNVDFEKT